MRVAWVFCTGLASLALAGCLRDPAVTSAGSVRSGAWWLATQTDRVTGETQPRATVTGLASNSYVDNPQPASLQMSCFDGKPLVRIGFEFKVGSDPNSVLGYRFDDKPGRDNVEGVRFLAMDRTVVIEEPAAVAQFVRDMRGSSTVYIRIRSITNGMSTVEFKIDGTEAAIDAAFRQCPVNENPPSAARRRVS